jgi:hypothetical protein
MGGEFVIKIPRDRAIVGFASQIAELMCVAGDFYRDVEV